MLLTRTQKDDTDKVQYTQIQFCENFTKSQNGCSLMSSRLRRPF